MTATQPSVIHASILSADFGHLGEEVTQLLEAGVEGIHLDVMDHHYVPNLTFGPQLCQALRRHQPQALLDTHLMVAHVDPLIDAFAQAGANWISFHVEASPDARRSLHRIRQHGCQAGLAFSPRIGLESLPELLNEIDFVLVMTVEPGFGGQGLLAETLVKIETVARLIRAHQAQTGRLIRLQVDGGIHAGNIAELAAMGADTFVVGSAICHQPNYSQAVAQLQAALGVRPSLAGTGEI